MNDRVKDISKNLELIDFEILEEHWNTYTLADKSKIKGRVFITRLFKEQSKPDNIMVDLTSPVFTVIDSLPENRGKPNNEPSILEFPKIKRNEIHIDSSDEKWNIYKIKNSDRNIKVKLVVSDIYRGIDKFDKYGFPFYLVDSNVIVNVTEIPTLVNE